MNKRLFEIGLVFLSGRFVGPLFPRQRVFVFAGNDNSDFQFLQSLPVLVDTHQILRPLRFLRQIVRCKGEFFRRQRVQCGQQIIFRLQEFLMVTDRRLA